MTDLISLNVTVYSDLAQDNDSLNYSKQLEDLLDSMKGLENDDTNRNLFLVFMYSLIVIVSLAGNLLVCKVVYELKESRTTTNVLIGNLAISDLLMTVLNIPFNIARVVLDNWPFGETLCILVPFVQSTSAHCSSITMMVIAIERYRSLIHNTHVNGNCGQRCQNRRTGILPFANILVTIWFLSALFSLPNGVFNQVIEIMTYRVLIRCYPVYPEPVNLVRRRITVVTVFSQYLIPIFLTCVCYLRIGCFLWRKEIVGTQSEFHRLSLLRRKKRRIKMLIIVVLAFAISWLPLNLYHLLTEFNVITPRTTIFFMVHWFAMSSVCYNPFIYCWLNENFRRKAKLLFTFIPTQTTERLNNSMRLNNSSTRMNDVSVCDNTFQMNTINTDVNVWTNVCVVESIPNGTDNGTANMEHV